MVEVLVWLLVLVQHDGGVDTRLTFKSEVQCAHVLKQVKESRLGYTRGACIQANIYIKKD